MMVLNKSKHVPNTFVFYIYTFSKTFLYQGAEKLYLDKIYTLNIQNLTNIIQRCPFP